MSDSPAHPAPAREAVAAEDAEMEARLADFDELRRLMFGAEQEQLSELQARLDDTARLAADVSRALPDAVKLRSAEDRKLIQALSPPVVESLKFAARRSPQRLSEALFPVIGPAVRKAIAHAFSRMTEAINQTLEYSLSPRSLKWRLEAWRTGRKFGEIVLYHTLLYRVEQVFLIHRETGLMLQHVAAEAVVAQDADLVSAMLTAIQDFVRDSFGAEQGDALEGLKFGELSVWVEQGPQATVAAVIRGFAPAHLRPALQSALEEIHREQGEALEIFAGDAAAFEASRPALEECLLAQYQSPARQEPRRERGVTLAVAAVALVALLAWGFFAVRERRRWDALVARLKAERGIVVTEAGRSGGKYYVRGLRDPLAADPQSFVAPAQLDPADVVMQWEPYHSLHADFVLARARAALEPPPTVTLSLTDGMLSARGAASTEWLAEAKRLARAIPGVTKFVADGGALLRGLQAAIENESLRFVAKSAELLPGQEAALRALVRGVGEMDEAAQAAGQDVLIRAVGHTDSTGTKDTNLTLSRERAARALAALAAHGLTPQQLKRTRLAAEGVADLSPARAEATERDREANRRVSFRVEFTAAGQPPAARQSN
jgi:outer membrane protein OmpA-like peptidoglycan-associated protein